jgi:hypothetical protein
MSFDAIFDGTPTSINASGGNAKLAVNTVTGALYYSTPTSGGYQPTTVSGGLLTATIVLSQAQIIQSAGGHTPFPVLIPAPGPGLYNNVLFLTAEYSLHGGTVFSGFSGGSWEVSYFTGSELWSVFTALTTGFLDQSVASITNGPCSLGSESIDPQQVIPASQMVNFPIVFELLDSISGGTPGANTLTFTIVYQTLISQ